MIRCSAQPEGEIRGHEFHHWDSENTGGSFTAVKASGKSWKCVHATETLYAGYPHFHFYANLDFLKNFYEACMKYALGSPMGELAARKG